MTWYEKMAFAGIAVGAIGAAMYITGLAYMLNARNQAMASYKASIQQAHDELLKR